MDGVRVQVSTAALRSMLTESAPELWTFFGAAPHYELDAVVEDHFASRRPPDATRQAGMSVVA